ncbi:hypothetical protein F4604DRAFT_1112676 [Suillus subluteus]|nr:hypothetical protein F4604DRAFT_1112676 [Suillus subluteus]
MRIILQQQTTPYSGVSYICPCGAVNTLGVGPIMYSVERQAGSSIDWSVCFKSSGRRFQISRVSSRTERSIRSSSIDSDHTTDSGMDLIRNFHIHQSEAHSLDEMFLCMWDVQHRLRCNALIRGHNFPRHLHEAHGIHGSDRTRVFCLWRSCNKELNKESLSRHVEEVHLRITFSSDCGNMYSHRHTLKLHKRTCTGL